MNCHQSGFWEWFYINGNCFFVCVATLAVVVALILVWANDLLQEEVEELHAENCKLRGHNRVE